MDAVREKDIDALKKVGCEVIHFGVESGSQEIIKKITNIFVEIKIRIHKIDS